MHIVYSPTRKNLILGIIGVKAYTAIIFFSFSYTILIIGYLLLVYIDAGEVMLRSFSNYIIILTILPVISLVKNYLSLRKLRNHSISIDIPENKKYIKIKSKSPTKESESIYRSVKKVYKRLGVVYAVFDNATQPIFFPYDIFDTKLQRVMFIKFLKGLKK